MIKKIFFLTSIIIMVNSGCEKGTTIVYFDEGMVEISFANPGRVDFFIPDLGASGWNYGDTGNATETLSIWVKENSGKEISLSGISWRLYSINEWLIYDGTEFVPPIILPANDSTLVQVPITIDEGLAHQIDIADGIEDYTNTGTFKFWAVGYDNEYYKPIGSNYIYSEMSVQKP